MPARRSIEAPLPGHRSPGGRRPRKALPGSRPGPASAGRTAATRTAWLEGRLTRVVDRLGQVNRVLALIEEVAAPRRGDDSDTLLISRRRLYQERYRLNAYRALLQAQMDGVL